MRRYLWLLLLLTVVAAAGVGGALALSLGSVVGLRYEQEWVRGLLQVGLVAVLGVVTSAVLERLKESIQQRRDLSMLRHDVLSELSRAFMDVKLVRRKLQASKAFTATDIDELNQLQVLVELRMRNSVRLFRKSSELKGYLRTMENYLNKVANHDASLERKRFCSNGFDNFAAAYELAATLIQDELAGR